VTTRRGRLRCSVGAALATVTLMAAAGTATAVPPPPPNPSDAEIEAGRAAAAQRVEQVGRLANRLAELEAQRQAGQAQAELAMELANKARIDLEAAQEQAARAGRAAEQAATEAAAAGRAIEDARRRVDRFASGSYQQGSTIGSVTAFFGASGPDELLARAYYLDAIGESQLDVLDGLERARAEQANKDSAARRAWQEADARRAAADQAHRSAEQAYARAREATARLAREIGRIDAAKGEVERQLAAAEAGVGELRLQRQRYLEWQAAKQREEAAAAAAAGAPLPGVGAGRVSAVIARALSQRGVPYAWGGGDATGPTRGARDGGIADFFGDYDKIGFDCSGLMVYAFAVVGVSLPHYSGYQYLAGRRVPLSAKRPGDLLFWGGEEGIHHVALYLGRELMVEAPYSGSQVRVAPVRYDGIVPFATRLL
jgi:cell wall-associated NlpC family hydrolase